MTYPDRAQTEACRVYTIALLGSERIPPPTIDDVVAETRTTYRGPLVFGEDLMAFEIGESVLVRQLELS